MKRKKAASVPVLDSAARSELVRNILQDSKWVEIAISCLSALITSSVMNHHEGILIEHWVKVTSEQDKQKWAQKLLGEKKQVEDSIHKTIDNIEQTQRRWNQFQALGCTYTPEAEREREKSQRLARANGFKQGTSPLSSPAAPPNDAISLSDVSLQDEPEDVTSLPPTAPDSTAVDCVTGAGDTNLNSPSTEFPPEATNQDTSVQSSPHTEGLEGSPLVDDDELPPPPYGHSENTFQSATGSGTYDFPVTVSLCVGSGSYTMSPVGPDKGYEEFREFEMQSSTDGSPIPDLAFDDQSKSVITEGMTSEQVTLGTDKTSTRTVSWENSPMHITDTRLTQTSGSESDASSPQRGSSEAEATIPRKSRKPFFVIAEEQLGPRSTNSSTRTVKFITSPLEESPATSVRSVRSFRSLRTRTGSCRTFMTGVIQLRESELQEFNDQLNAIESVVSPEGEFSTCIADTLLLDASCGAENCVSNRSVFGEFANKVVDEFLRSRTSLVDPNPNNSMTVMFVHLHEALNACKKQLHNALNPADILPTHQKNVQKFLKFGMLSRKRIKEKSVENQIVNIEVYCISARSSLAQLAAVCGVVNEKLLQEEISQLQASEEEEGEEFVLIPHTLAVSLGDETIRHGWWSVEGAGGTGGLIPVRLKFVLLLLQNCIANGHRELVLINSLLQPH